MRFGCHRTGRLKEWKRYEIGQFRGRAGLHPARGKSSAAELLAFLRERLGNEPGTEWRVVAAELAKINQIRLRKLVADAGAGEAP